VTVPLVLLLTVRRLQGSLNRRDLVRSAPFFVCSFIPGVVTLNFQYSRAIGEEATMSWSRGLNAVTTPGYDPSRISSHPN
jgi:hypothetical protein